MWVEEAAVAADVVAGAYQKRAWVLNASGPVQEVVELPDIIEQQVEEAGGELEAVQVVWMV